MCDKRFFSISRPIFQSWEDTFDLSSYDSSVEHPQELGIVHCRWHNLD